MIPGKNELRRNTTRKKCDSAGIRGQKNSIPARNRRGKNRENIGGSAAAKRAAATS